MSHAPDLFSLPPIVLPKVTLAEILTELRQRVNKFYMPSATGEVVYNSKPEYTERPNPEFPHFPQIHQLDQSGYFCLQKPNYQWGKEPVFFNLHIDRFQIVIDLTTEQAIIRYCDVEDSNPFREWQNVPEQAIPLRPDHLKELIDIYG